MRSLASVFSATAFLLLLLIIPSFTGQELDRPQLLYGTKRAIEKRSYFDSLVSLFNKRDQCTTQFGSTYVDCGSQGCYQPSLGEVCCGANSLYCPKGEFCVGNNCCPNGLTGACCVQGVGCPANVSSYYTSSPTAAKTTSSPVVVSTSAKVSTTTAKLSTSSAVAATTPLTAATATATPLVTTTSGVAGVSGTTSTSSKTSSAQSGGGVSSVVAGSGSQGRRMMLSVEDIVVGVLGVVGFIAGLI